jgi:hypothetical protein
MNRKKVDKALIDIALKIAKQGKGCLLVIKEGKLDYDLLFEQDIKPFNAVTDARRLEVVALVDGATIVDTKGDLIAYSAKIKSSRTFKGFGTRHAAALSASVNNMVIMASEEDHKVKVFKKGRLLMQIDPFQKDIEYKTNEVVTILESVGAGSLATIGTSLLVPALGIALIPGIVVFGSAHYLMKLLVKKK